MNLENHYYYFKSALGNKFCSDLLKFAKEKKEQIAITGKEKEILIKNNNKLEQEHLETLKKTRDSNIVWVDDRWVYRTIIPFINEANQRANWNFEWDYSESCQFTIYREGQHYHWHRDSWEFPYNDENDKGKFGKIRKLSATISLNDSTEYEGGELEFCFDNLEPNKQRTTKKCLEILSKGSIVVFPSFVWHKVNPVLKGTRYSLVVWNCGKPYR